jgi:pyridoxal phosphate enzyme (YggS family)
MTQPEDTGRRDELATNLASVQERIAAACTAAGRPREEVTLIVVTKTYPRSDVVLLKSLGVTDVGENRHPEAAQKVVDGVRMHFIGGLQTNKAAAVGQYADVVQSVDRSKLVAALSRSAAARERELGCLVQIDFGADATGRSGCRPADAQFLADEVSTAPGLRLDGVMTVAPLGVDPAPVFDSLIALSGELRRQHPSAGIVSAGMSDDFEAAVKSGATHLRVGRSVLGERDFVR